MEAIVTTNSWLVPQELLTSYVFDMPRLQERLDDIKHRRELREYDGLLSFTTVFDILQQLQDRADFGRCWRQVGFRNQRLALCFTHHTFAGGAAGILAAHIRRIESIQCGGRKSGSVSLEILLGQDSRCLAHLTSLFRLCETETTEEVSELVCVVIDVVVVLCRFWLYSFFVLPIVLGYERGVVAS